jgi:hypothetical protein
MRDTVLQIPIKPFVYFDFRDWVASLLSRPGYEDMMDDAWGARHRGDPDCLSDIFDGTVLRNFKGPDGRLFGAIGAEGHYAFSLNVDFFNPHGNSTGKSISCGIMALVCLNLPPNLRYKPDNMFLAGIIPGPREPPLSCINNYLRPLVDDLVDFWMPSVRFSRTFKCPSGRKVTCAIVAVTIAAGTLFLFVSVYLYLSSLGPLFPFWAVQPRGIASSYYLHCLRSLI